MEVWIIYALITSLWVGLYWFAQKIKAENPKQSDTGFIFYTYLIFLVTGLTWVYLTWESWVLYDYTAMTYSFWIMFLYTIVVKTRLLSLRYLSSSTYFINYRIFSSIWLLLLGMFVFSETISFKEILWVLVGFIVFYLLIEKKDNTESKKDLQRGFIFMFIWSICIAGLQSINKDFALSWLNIYFLVLYSGFFGIIFAILLKGKEKIYQIVEIQSWRQGVFLITSWIIFSIATVTNNLAFIWWDLAIVYKIISYSLFIPIILSIIFYKEQVSSKKLIAFALTVLSIFLFI